MQTSPSISAMNHNTSSKACHCDCHVHMLIQPDGLMLELVLYSILHVRLSKYCRSYVVTEEKARQGPLQVLFFMHTVYIRVYYTCHACITIQVFTDVFFHISFARLIPKNMLIIFLGVDPVFSNLWSNKKIIKNPSVKTYTLTK